MFTVAGQYTTRGWTEWTQGFQFGSALLQFDATDDEQFLEIATKEHGRKDGTPSDAYRRTRPRIQQRLDLWQFTAYDP